MENKELSKTSNNKTVQIILAVLGTLYGVSPIDILPDVVPVFGWIDDVMIMGTAYLNLAQAFIANHSQFMAKLLGLVKWIIIILGGILIAILALLGTAIYQLFN